MKLRNIVAILLINAFLFGSLYYAASFWAEDRLPKTRKQFLTSEQVVFYKKYAAELNHLRVFDFQSHMHQDADKATTDFLFSKIGNGGRTILIQGDSWAEQMVLGHQSFIVLQNFAEQNNVRFIVGGTNSYSPSLMAVQNRLLKQDFNISPEIVVGIIDQTDIGDELCRYRSRRSKNQQGEDIVLPYDGDIVVPYLLTRYFELIDILDGPQGALYKLIKYRLVKSKTMLQGGCVHQILSPLEGQLSDTDKQYFEERVDAYINEVFRAPSRVKRLVLVTHFHKKHETGEYKISIANLVKNSVERSAFKGQIEQVDFKPDVYASEDKSRIFKEGDLFSHLTDYMHRKIFTNKILQMIGTLE
jgi:hypothetical protein